MKRGQIWTAAGGGAYDAKPRPVVIMQNNAFDATASITVCPLTSDPTDTPLMRLVIEPSEVNGLKTHSRLMVDKLATLPRTNLGKHVGKLSDTDVARLDRAILIFLGLAS